MQQTTGGATSEFLKLLPELTATLYRAAPHEAALRGPIKGPFTAAQMKAVIHLGLCGSQTMSEFATGLGISRAAATEMVERLSEKSIVLREPDVTDRRVVRVRLEPAAGRFVGRVLADWQRRLDGAFAEFPGLDRETLIAFLRTLTERLKGSLP